MYFLSFEYNELDRKYATICTAEHYIISGLYMLSCIAHKVHHPRLNVVDWLLFVLFFLPHTSIGAQIINALLIYI